MSAPLRYFFVICRDLRLPPGQNENIVYKKGDVRRAERKENGANQDAKRRTAEKSATCSGHDPERSDAVAAELTYLYL